MQKKYPHPTAHQPIMRELPTIATAQSLAATSVVEPRAEDKWSRRRAREQDLQRLAGLCSRLSINVFSDFDLAIHILFHFPHPCQTATERVVACIIATAAGSLDRWRWRERER